MRHLRVVSEIAFGEYGGAECFFYDLDGDGKKEIVTYQGPGIFGTALLKDHPRCGHVREFFPRSVCVSAFRLDGTRLWTWGAPNAGERPYICHSAECVAACGDIDGDGAVEVAVADGDRVVVLDGRTGAEKGTGALPWDNFYIIAALGAPTGGDEAAVVVKNGEMGYEGWGYGEPVIGLNSGLAIAWGPVALSGGGHHILALDLNGDGRKEYLNGYQAVAPDGTVLWTVDGVDPGAVNIGEMHVDLYDWMPGPEGRKLIAIAGSDKCYLVEEGGRTVFSYRGVHCQGVALGRFRGGEGRQMALYNSPAGPMQLLDLEGVHYWAARTERRWPLGAPACFERGRFHKNRPIVTVPTAEGDYIGYADGGWPWGMDGEGRISLEFEAPASSRYDEPSFEPRPRARLDDLGYGFYLQAVDLEGKGVKEAVIYDRRFLWRYDLG